MAWIILFIAGLLEVVWSVGLKYTEGFTKLTPSVITVAAMVLSVVLLGMALRTLPLGVGYSVWVGIGVVGSVIAGIFLFNESMDLIKMISVLLIVAGIIGLKMSVAS